MQEHSQTEPSTYRDPCQRGGSLRSRRKVDRHVPWTLMIPLERTGERMFECACHDGNYGLEAILRGTREQEKQST